MKAAQYPHQEPRREDNPVSVLEANSGGSAGPIDPSPGPEGEVVAVVGPPTPEVN
jgi:hypothetical protein